MINTLHSGERIDQEIVRSDQQIGENVIQVTDLTKQFGEELVVNGVSFDVPRASVFGFIGPSGCGKTTTVRMNERFIPSIPNLIAPAMETEHGPLTFSRLRASPVVLLGSAFSPADFSRGVRRRTVFRQSRPGEHRPIWTEPLHF